MILLTTGGQVNFPGLGINLEHVIRGFNIFGIHISLSGIIIAISMFLALFITERLAKKTEQNTEQYLDLAIRIVLASVLGARIGYVFSHWQIYIADQENVFDIRDGGASSVGAIAAGLLMSYFYCRQKKISWLQICDTSMPGIAAAQMLSSFGCFFGRNVLGTYSDGTFAMQVSLNDVDDRVRMLGAASPQMIRGNFIQVHPISLYEAAALFILLVFLLILWKICRISGVLLSVYLIGYGAILFGIEFIRLDSQRILESSFSMEHFSSAFLVIFGITILINQIRKNRMLVKAQPKKLFSGKK